MLRGRVLRHAALLGLFVLLLLIGCLFENALDESDTTDGRYADDLHEQRGEGVRWRAIFHTPSYWRSVPLTLDRSTYPYVTDAFEKEYINRTTPPQLDDVRDDRTRMSSDFFEQLQLWRRPGETAAKLLHLLQAQIAEERIAARTLAVQQRNLTKSWKTRASTSSRSLLSFLSRSSSFTHEEEEEGEQEGRADGLSYVEGRYDTSVMYCAARNGTANRPGNVFASAVRRVAVSLATDEAQLVPYPFVPAEWADKAAEVAADAVAGGEQPPATTTPTAAHDAQQPASSSVVVRIDKGKRRHSVPHRETPHQPTHGWNRYFIALNLWKNEKVLPDLTEALLVFLQEEVQPFFPLATSVVVSIFANISPDRTAELIETLLIPRLHAAGVKTVYATTEGACLGYVERQPFHERIEWMACIRNKALGPLYEYGMSVFDVDAPLEATTGAPPPQSPLFESAGRGDDEGLVVLFFNDIFFRPQDITTLLESQAEPLMQHETRPHGWQRAISASSTAANAHAAGAVKGNRQHLQKDSAAPQTESTHTGTTFDMACGMDFYYTFYDTWVTRDRLGNPFEAQMPYSDDHATQRALYRIFNHDTRQRRQLPQRGGRSVAPAAAETFAIPVKCCWNGVAAIRGRFFLPPSLKHRQGFPSSLSTTSAPDAVPTVEFLDQRRHEQTTPQKRTAVTPLPATAPAVVRRRSGAVYDALGPVQDTVARTGLARYYTRILARRLQSERVSWNSTRREIAELIDIPFYQPVVYDNSSSFIALLAAVQQQQHEGEDGTREGFALDGAEAWRSLTLAFDAAGPLLSSPPVASALAEVRRSGNVRLEDGATAVNERLSPRQQQLRIAAQEDSTYFAARHPAVRFRHAFTPSYGATVSGRAPVRDDVCLSSECLLICQDVMQAAILQDRRAPVMLLNPHVRVAYDHDHFARVTRHTWFFEHPYVYWAWVMARRTQLWCRRHMSFRWRHNGAASAAETAAAPEVRELGQATSATDDWLAFALNSGTAGTVAAALLASSARSLSQDHLLQQQQALAVEDAFGHAMDAGVVDLATLTRMDCQRITAGSVGLAAGAFYPLLRLGQLLVVALLLRWLCWQAQADVLKHSNGEVSGGGGLSNSPPPNAVTAVHPSADGTHLLSSEERWWRAAYNGIWYSRPARRIRAWIESLSKEDQMDGGQSRSSSSHARHAGNRGRSTSATSSTAGAAPVTPLLHLQLRQYYRRKKLAATLGTAATSTQRIFHRLARTVLWLLGTVCCVRWWCGCRHPGPPPASAAACAHTRCGQVWDQFVVGDISVGSEEAAAAAVGAEDRLHTRSPASSSDDGHSGGSPGRAVRRPWSQSSWVAAGGGGGGVSGGQMGGEMAATNGLPLRMWSGQDHQLQQQQQRRAPVPRSSLSPHSYTLGRGTSAAAATTPEGKISVFLETGEEHTMWPRSSLPPRAQASPQPLQFSPSFSAVPRSQHASAPVTLAPAPAGFPFTAAPSAAAAAAAAAAVFPLRHQDSSTLPPQLPHALSLSSPLPLPSLFAEHNPVATAASVIRSEMIAYGSCSGSSSSPGSVSGPLQTVRSRNPISRATASYHVRTPTSATVPSSSGVSFPADGWDAVPACGAGGTVSDV